MICKFCGNVIEDNSDFCFICGQKVVAEAPAYATKVYSQESEGAPAEVEPAPAPVAAEPVYTAPVEPAYASAAMPEQCKKCRKMKKAMTPVDPSVLTMKEKVLIGLFAALFLAVAGIMCKNIIVVAVCAVLTAVVAYVYYKQYNKAIAEGYEAKALDILNIGMIGLCVGMAVVVVGLFVNFVIG